MSAYRKQAERPVTPEEPTPDFSWLSPRRRRLLAGLGVLALAGAAAALVHARRERARDLAALADHAQIIQHCLLRPDVGGRAGASFEARVREIRLGTLAERWPSSCTEQVAQLRDEAAAAGRPPDVLAELQRAHAALQHTPSRRDFAPAMRQALAALDRAAGTTLPFPAVPEAPAVASLDTLDDAARLYAGVGSVAFERHPGPERALLTQPAGAASRELCRVRAAALTCRPIAARATTPAKLDGTHAADVPPLIFDARLPGVRHGAAGTDRDIVTTADGSEVTRTLIASGATVTADGTAYVLGPKVMDAFREFSVPSIELFLATRAPSGTLALQRMDYDGVRTNHAAVLWDRLFARVVVGESLALVSRPLATGAFTRVFAEPSERYDAPLDGCRTERVSVVRSAGRLAFWDAAGVFSEPLEVPSAGRLGCHEDSASVVQVEGDPTVTGVIHTHCTATGCAETHLVSDAFFTAMHLREPLQRADLRAVALGGRLLLVWHSEQADGLLLMRLSTPAAIADAPDRIVFDDHWSHGRFDDESSLLGFEVEPLGDTALVVLTTTRGAHVLHIDANGAVTPFTVQH